MKRFYAIIVKYSVKNSPVGVNHLSQEAYSTLEEAQRFCIGRGAKKETPMLYKEETEDKIIIYEIHDLRVK